MRQQKFQELEDGRHNIYQKYLIKIELMIR